MSEETTTFAQACKWKRRTGSRISPRSASGYVGKGCRSEVLKDLSARKQLFDAPKFEHGIHTAGDGQASDLL